MGLWEVQESAILMKNPWRTISTMSRINYSYKIRVHYESKCAIHVCDGYLIECVL